MINISRKGQPRNQCHRMPVHKDTDVHRVHWEQAVVGRGLVESEQVHGQGRRGDGVDDLRRLILSWTRMPYTACHINYGLQSIIKENGALID